MNIAERISTLRRANGLSARQLAALVDVAPTTVTRIEAGTVSPSFDLASEILRVLGEPIGFTGETDPDVLAAARLALDPTLPIAVTDGVVAWWERWARIRLVDEDGTVLPGQRARLLFRAATVARLSRRADAADYLPTTSARNLVETLGGAGIDHALTGDSAANLYSPGAGEVWPVLYVADVAAAAQTAGLRRREPGTFGGRVTLIGFDGVCETGRERVDGVMTAALDQVILDCYGGTGRMAEQADQLLGRAA
ncbi:helix-turn-helix transcriptional regulator [Cellulosimicrobium sp. SH8]|uniref:helix-turn-helix transcriptional regulator n=1 Tax=Cellulosimicrobium sp. SH8 TaxID=2952936 RepID=UPI0021F281DD|nr:helix-turn-helix transcriptional regulator [Cellulosimicrobium sp. SH8]